MRTNFDRQKSLQVLEGEDWGEPNYDSSLVQACHRLSRIPLADFSTEDLRIMIGQKIGLLFLVPLALEELEDNPLVEASYYSGDLLNVVLGIPETYWNVHTDMRDVLCRIVAKAKALLVDLDESDARFVREGLSKASNLLHE